MNHDNIYHAIDQIDQVTDHINNLKALVMGVNPGNEDEERKEEVRTLHHLLTGGADLIVKKCDQSHKALAELQECLFGEAG